MVDTEKKARATRRKYITQPCRLPLANGDVAEVIIRFPESAAREVHWQITSETVLITTGEQAATMPPSPATKRPTPLVGEGTNVSPFHSSATSIEEQIENDAELLAARDRGASIDEIEEILANRRLAATPLRIASGRGAEIASRAASLRRISIDVDGEHVEHELSATGGTT